MDSNRQNYQNIQPQQQIDRNLPDPQTVGQQPQQEIIVVNRELYPLTVTVGQKNSTLREQLSYGYISVTINSFKLILSTSAYFIGDCGKQEMNYFLLAIMLKSSISLIISIYLIKKTLFTKLQLSRDGQEAKIEYNDLELSNVDEFQDALFRNNPSISIAWYTSFCNIFILQYTNRFYGIIFIGGCVIIIINLDEPTCPIEQAKFIWATLLILITIGFFQIGIPILLLIVYLIIRLFLYIRLHQLSRSQNQELIKKLKSSKYAPDSNLTDVDKCVICLTDFKAKDDFITLKCSRHHIFHKNCLIEWLSVNCKCPLCK